MFLITLIISNSYILYLNKKYEKMYKNTESNINTCAVILNEKKEKEYTYSYTIKIKDGEYKNKKFILTLKKTENNILKYGDLIEIDGKYFQPNKGKNYKGFDYSNYLKSKKIYGTIIGQKIKKISENNLNVLFIKSNRIRNNIINKANILLPMKTRGLLIGLLIGDKEEIQEETINNFRESSLSHILAVSGLHISYIVLRNNIYIK